MSRASEDGRQGTDRKRKRSSAATLETADPSARGEKSLEVSASSTMARLLQEHQVEALQAELDHERSMRLLDRRRYEQDLALADRRVELAAEDAKKAREMLELHREEGDRVAAQLRQAQDRARQELRRLQLERASSYRSGDDEFHDDEEDDRSGGGALWKAKCQRLEALLQSQKDDEQSMRKELEQLRQDLLDRQAQLASMEASAVGVAGGDAKMQALLEEAPPAILRELSAVRLGRAEAERRCRQLQRAADDTKKQVERLIREREEARIQAERLPKLQGALEELQNDYERTAAENRGWKEFAQALQAHFNAMEINVRSPTAGPVEVATILRYMEKAQHKALHWEKEKTKYENECQRLRGEATLLHTKELEWTRVEQSYKDEREKLVQQLDDSQRKIQSLEGQQVILKREVDSLRALIKTFDDMPLAPKALAGATKFDTSAKTLEVTLATARQELSLAKEDRQRLASELEAARKRSEEEKQELVRVREKFGKLREALEAEKGKVEAAEERANRAEALAGGGAFDPDRSRVLHLGETPLVEALREEVKVLRRQIEVVRGGEKPSKLAPDPDKLNQRLKENFKEQIALFREGVYLMTGYKVDMLPGTDRPTFRVRSVYGEREEDHLMLKWPKSEDVTSLDILDTDFAKVLTTTHSYEYMTKFHSLPAFLASVQLSLFEKQTVMM